MTTSSRRVLIAGCGYVGSRLATRLLAQGVSVFGLTRSEADLPAGVRPIVADLTRPETLGNLPTGPISVVYSASADDPSEQAYEAAYVRGPANLIAALRSGDGRVDRLIFISSTAVYQQSDGSWVDERSPTQPSGFRGRVLLEGERVVQQSPFAAIVVRFGGIYGPTRTRLVDLVRSGRATVGGGPIQWTNRIHRDDCAGTLAHLLSLPEPESVYIGVDREPAARRDVLRWIADALDLPAPAGSRDVGSSRLNPTSKRCSSARLATSGYRFTYPSFREGYGELIRDPSGDRPV